MVSPDFDIKAYEILILKPSLPFRNVSIIFHSVVAAIKIMDARYAKERHFGLSHLFGDRGEMAPKFEQNSAFDMSSLTKK